MTYVQLALQVLSVSVSALILKVATKIYRLSKEAK